MRTRIFVVCLTMVIAALGRPAPGQESTVRIGTHGAGGGIPRFMDPFDQVGRMQADLENIYEPLLYPFRDTLELRGVLAESWSSAEGGALWTFKLRPNVKFHDNTELTAEAVKLSFERTRQVGRSTAAGLLTDVQEVRVVDPLTVQFRLRLAGGPPFPHRLTSLLIASAKALRDHANDPAWFRDHAVGTGPFMLEEFVPRDRMVLRRFEGYWGRKPFFTRAIFLEIPEPATKAQMLERGQIDIAYNLPPQSLPVMRRNPQLRVIQVPGDRVISLRLNVSQGPFSNRAFRKAVAYAMDYEAFVRARAEDVGLPEGPVPKSFMHGWTPPNLIVRQNLEQARKFLAESGLRPTDTRITINVAAGYEIGTNAAEILQASLRRLGVDARIQSVDFSQMDFKLRRFAQTKDPADSEDSMSLVRGPFLPHAGAYFTSYAPGFFTNWFDYRNERATQLIELGYVVEGRDADRAMQNYRSAVRMIVDDQPDLWLGVEKKVVVMRSDVHGYYIHPIWFPETHVFTLFRR